MEVLQGALKDPEVMIVTGTHRCMMGPHRGGGNARHPCKGWTCPPCRPANVLGRRVKEWGTMIRVEMEVSLRGTMAATADQDAAVEVAGVPEADQDPHFAAEDRGEACGADPSNWSHVTRLLHSAARYFIVKNLFCTKFLFVFSLT